MHRRRGVFPRTAGRVLLAAALAIACEGCAYSYLDAHGDRRVVGLVDLTIHRADGPTVAGNVVDIRAVGVSVLGNAQGSSVSVGYAHEVTAELRDNALVMGDPRRVGEPAPRSDPEEIHR